MMKRRIAWALGLLLLLPLRLVSADDAPPVPAPKASATAMAPAALDELLAPIALYPDALLAQVFAAASYPQEVMDGGNWLVAHGELKGQALQDEAAKAGFGPSMQALVLFPTVVDMMCQNFDWTKQLGSAFNTDQAAVLAAVQRLRAQAAEVGNLKSTPEQKVETQTIAGQQVIIIQPADPKIVYVPVYSPTTVYTVPPPVVAAGPTTGDVIAAGVFGFAAGVILTSIISDNHYPYPNWGYGGVWYGGRPWGGPVYVYHPHYHYGGYPPGYRPGGGYHRPPNYGNAWDRPGNWHGGNNTNININVNQNNNYFNRFGGNQNLKPGATRPDLVSPGVRDRPTTYKPPSTGGGRPGTGDRPTTRPAGEPSKPAWKGQSEYQGSTPGAMASITAPSASAANDPAVPGARGQSPAPKPLATSLAGVTTVPSSPRPPPPTPARPGSAYAPPPQAPARPCPAAAPPSAAPSPC